MSSSSATKFHKQAACPPSGTLLSYQAFALMTEQRMSIASHLATCDFCSAELQLLTKYPPCEDGDSCIQEALMPLSLRRLAEAILAGNTIDAATSLLARATYSKSALTLTDA